MINLTEYAKCLQIDKNNIDDELVRQPTLLYQVSEAYIEAVAVRDTKKDELATIDAELDAELRAEAGDTKTTEAKIKNEIQVHPEHQSASKAFNEAKHEADKLLVLKEAVAQRGYVLRDLAQLAVANFFETSSISSFSAKVYEGHRARLAEKRKMK
jgi:hypothetical protein